MQNIFGYSFLLSLFVLIAGLIDPKMFQKIIKNPTRAKVGLILGFISFALMIGIGVTAPEESPQTTSDQPAQSNTAQASNQPEIKEEPQLTEQDQIKKIVTDQLKGQNNMKKDNLKSVEVSEVEGGGWDVVVEFNAGDNLSTNLRKKGIESDMSELYILLYKSGKDIKTVSISAYFPLQDQYGNVNDRVIYASTLNSEEASKVNWNADQSSLKLSILPGVWTTTMLHPEFR